MTVTPQDQMVIVVRAVALLEARVLELQEENERLKENCRHHTEPGEFQWRITRLRVLIKELEGDIRGTERGLHRERDALADYREELDDILAVKGEG